MNCEQTTEFLFLRAEDELDPTTRESLDAHLATCVECRREAARIEQTWSLMGKFEPEPPSENLRARFYEMLELAQAEPSNPGTPSTRAARRGLSGWLEGWWPQQPAWQAAVAAACLLLGLWLGPRVAPGGAGRGDEIQALRSEMLAMNRMVTLSLLQHQSASQRLRAVSLSHRGTPDTEVVGALLDVINQDDSVNVRLAALDVLVGMLPRREVRDGLLAALPRQDSPTMQVALGEVLLAADGPRSRTAVEALLESETLAPPVREHLRSKIAEGGESL